jgi:hypothetical protein
METVTVVFTNGNIVTFHAQELDVDLISQPSVLNKLPYKNPNGEESFIHLRPRDVAGIFLTQSAGTQPPVTYRVPGSQS